SPGLSSRRCNVDENEKGAAASNGRRAACHRYYIHVPLLYGLGAARLIVTPSGVVGPLMIMSLICAGVRPPSLPAAPVVPAVPPSLPDAPVVPAPPSLPDAPVVPALPLPAPPVPAPPVPAPPSWPAVLPTCMGPLLLHAPSASARKTT